MSRNRPGISHRTSTYLEPSSGQYAVGYTAATAGLIWVQAENVLSELARYPFVTFFLILLTGVAAYGMLRYTRRWRASRVVLRMMRDRDLVALEPDLATRQPFDRPAPPQEPPLVSFIKVSRFVGVRGKRRVNRNTNVLGRPPMQIVYLRVFENRVRNRNFARGAWREFGYVHLLRSAASVSPAEARRIKAQPRLLLQRRDEVRAVLDTAEAAPLPPGWRRQPTIAGQTVLTYDRFGAYPTRDLLCHGKRWHVALDVLLERADLVVLDLSGYLPGNQGTQYELQRIVDTVPVHKVLLVADPRSNAKFLQAEVGAAWRWMAHGSPNVWSRRPVLGAFTDYYALVPQQTGQRSGPQQTRLELRPSRAQSRWLLDLAQRRLVEPDLRLPRSAHPGWPLVRAIAASTVLVAALALFAASAMPALTSGSSLPRGQPNGPPPATAFPSPPTSAEETTTESTATTTETTTPSPTPTTQTSPPTGGPGIGVDPTVVTCTINQCADVTIRSNGEADLELREIRVDDDLPSDQFRITGGCEEKTLAPGEYCTLAFQWTPEPGSRQATAQLIINQNLPGPNPTVVTLRGTAENLAISDVVCRWTARDPAELAVTVIVERAGSDAVDVQVTHTVPGAPPAAPETVRVQPHHDRATASFTVAAPTTSGQRVIVEVDPGRQVMETEETDNQQTLAVNPLPPRSRSSVAQQCPRA